MPVMQAEAKQPDAIRLEPLLLGAEDAATLLGIGRTLFLSMHSSGELGPLPRRLGRRTLWSREEIHEWVRAECPPRTKWQVMKKDLPRRNSA